MAALSLGNTPSPALDRIVTTDSPIYPPRRRKRTFLGCYALPYIFFICKDVLGVLVLFQSSGLLRAPDAFLTASCDSLRLTTSPHFVLLCPPLCYESWFVFVSMLSSPHVKPS